MHFVSGLHKALASSTASELQHGQHGQLVRLEQLPLRCVEHLSETRLIGAGFDGEVCPEVPPWNLSHASPCPFLGIHVSSSRVLALETRSGPGLCLDMQIEVLRLRIMGEHL